MRYHGRMNARVVALVALALAAACTPREKTVPDAGLADAGLLATVGAGPLDAGAAAPRSSMATKPTDGCIHVDADEAEAGITKLEGTVFSGTHGHPNGKTFTFYALTLPKPTCVTGADGVTTVLEVQLASTVDPATDVKKWVGKRVRVTGSAFPEQTAWHVRPVIVTVKTIEKL